MNKIAALIFVQFKASYFKFLESVCFEVMGITMHEYVQHNPADVDSQYFNSFFHSLISCIYQPIRNRGFSKAGGCPWLICLGRHGSKSVDVNTTTQENTSDVVLSTALNHERLVEQSAVLASTKW